MTEKVEIDFWGVGRGGTMVSLSKKRAKSCCHSKNWHEAIWYIVKLFLLKPFFPRMIFQGTYCYDSNPEMNLEPTN